MEKHFRDDESLQITREALTGYGIHASSEQIAELNRKIMNDAPRRLLMNSDKSDNVTKVLLELNWYIFDVANNNDWIPLITSASPLVILNGLKSPMTEVYFPLSPNLLFWASRSKIIENQRVRLREILKISNRQQANAAVKFVFGNSYEPFIDKYLRRN